MSEIYRRYLLSRRYVDGAAARRYGHFFFYHYPQNLRLLSKNRAPSAITLRSFFRGLILSS